MKMTLELDKHEVAEAIKMYLRAEKGFDVDPDNINFKLRTTGQRGGPQSKNFHKAECKNVTETTD